MTRWSEDQDKVGAANAALTECYSGPWGLKASEEDAIFAVAKALGLSGEFADDRMWIAPLAERLWDWKCETPSPLVEGLSQMIADGLKPGTTLPTDELAGQLETASYEDRHARFVLDLLQEQFEGAAS